ncbi:MAG: heme biosynthesis protein HemY, partial [Hydrogenovibrio sp.]|nr:heme biosynthesis protein HemY [Hydrogenovibrio sp.]
QPDILAEFVEQRMGWGQEQGLAELIAKSLKKGWNDRLVYQYGRIQFGPAFDRFKVAEGWLSGQEENPVLLLTLGRLACMSQFWGAAHAYLKRSLAIRPEVETFHVLAKCYEAEGLDSEAALTYKEAILQLENKASG